MDARDDLREALSGHQERSRREDDEVERRRAALAEAQRQYEEEEREVFAYLRDLADTAVAALAQSTETKRLPITPPLEGLGRVLRRRQYVDGWKVVLGNYGERILCPDGTLIIPAAPFYRSDPDYSTLRAWIDHHRHELHQGRHTESVRPQTPWGKAFSMTTPCDDRAAAQRTMWARLQSLKESVTDQLASILHQHDASI